MPHRLLPSLVAALAVALLAAPAAPAAPAKVRSGPKGLTFYAPPSPLPKGKHGAAIWTRGLSGAAALKGAGANRLLLYRSTGTDGKPMAVSATVTFPKGKPPRGGWPVVTYGHGTTGIADRCAPSRDSASSSVHVYNSYAYPLLERWLKAGYAVVRTDYQGLGTPGVHEYLNGPAEGRSMLDAVRAARRLGRLSENVAIAGHSQGGHAALWAASIAPKWTPELKVRGTIAFAPVSHLGEQTAILPSLDSTLGGLGGLASLIVRGLDAARPQLQVPVGLSDRAAALYPRTLTECLPDLSQPGAFGGLTGRQFLREGIDTSAVTAAIGANDPEGLRIRTPVRVVQGGADTTVLPPFTERLRDAYRARGNPLVYHAYEDANHVSIVEVAAKPSTEWLNGWLKR